MSAHYIPSITDRTSGVRETPYGYFVEPRALKVMWAKDKRYWKRQNDNDTGPFELIQVSWLEVTGTMAVMNLDKNETYKVVFNVKMNKGAFGFDEPVYVMARVAREKYAWRKVFLDKLDTDKDVDIPIDGLTFKREKDYVKNEDFTFGLFDIWSGTWKGGLVINYVKIIKVV